MKKNILLIMFGLMFVATMASFVYASGCSLNATLINQDPYPAVPGEYVKLVFQISGVSDPTCGQVKVELANEFPISFDPNVSNILIVNAGTYASDYSSVLIAPFKVRVDKSALGEGNQVTLKYTSGKNLDDAPYITKKFDLELEDTGTDFEVSVKDYNYATKIITFEILNVGKNDVESLVADIPIQDNIDIKGSRRDIIGSLDSNDDTTFTFESSQKNGQISMVLLYNDGAGVRRQVEKSVMFNSADFKNRVRDSSSSGKWVFFIVVLIAIAVWYFRRRHKKKKAEQARKFR